jgi:hypothetical protein
MKVAPQTPLVGEPAIYEGFYLSHWRHGPVILVCVPRRSRFIQTALVWFAIVPLYWFGLFNSIALLVIGAAICLLAIFPPCERWKPVWPAEPPDRLDDGETGTTIQFEGEVSVPESIADWAFMRRPFHRTVKIIRVSRKTT